MQRSQQSHAFHMPRCPTNPLSAPCIVRPTEAQGCGAAAYLALRKLLAASWTHHRHMGCGTRQQHLPGFQEVAEPPRFINV
jgi:hypothetical protein